MGKSDTEIHSSGAHVSWDWISLKPRTQSETYMQKAGMQIQSQCLLSIIRTQREEQIITRHHHGRDRNSKTTLRIEDIEVVRGYMNIEI